jgi:phospholipid/cholesterol/gamma-HCH transport system ATP-binding protein
VSTHDHQPQPTPSSPHPDVAAAADPVVLRGVGRRFGDQQVLRDLTMEVRSGETLVVIGESGCGKSVTLKLMMSLLRPTSGEVHWDGRSVSELDTSERDRRRLRLGYVFQNSALFDSFDVFENVAFGLRESVMRSGPGGRDGLDEAEIRAVVLDRLEEVGLPAEVCSKNPSELSGGMRKRVALARALALEPSVMLYDEPTAGLDPVMTGVINRLIREVPRRRPVTSVVVTHDLSTVRAVADRLVMLEPVSRLAEGEPQAIFSGSIAEALSSSDPRVAAFLQGGSEVLEREAG